MSKAYTSYDDDFTPVSKDRKRDKNDWKDARKAKAERRQFEQGDNE